MIAETFFSVFGGRKVRHGDERAVLRSHPAG